MDTLEEKRLNNEAVLTGVLAGRPTLSHISRDVAYMLFPLEVRRLSGAFDRINIMARQTLLEQLTLEERGKIKVSGELRSFNNKTGTGSRLVITVFAQEINLTDEDDQNTISLRGVLCKPPNLRRTPMGREICDLMLAIPRRYGRSDYLPCISWGQNAVEAAAWPVGTAIAITGRVQSRKYVKLEAGIGIEKTAFEVSVISQATVDAT